MSSRDRIYIAQARECDLALEKDDFEVRLVEAIESAPDCVLVDSADEADIVLINQSWKSRNWHDLRFLESCSFIAAYAEKILTLSHDSISTIFFPGLYVSLTKKNNWAGWVRPSGYKRQYRSLAAIPDLDLTNQQRWLFSFRGADFSHPVRRTLTKSYGTGDQEFLYIVVNKMFHSHTDADHEIYLREMLSSHFVLAPRGISPSSYRMFEAMQHGRCPVIISDEWQPIPGVDWHKCSIRVSEEDAGSIYSILKKRVGEAEVLGQNAKKVWMEHFADGIREQIMLRNLRELHRNCDQPRNMASLKKLWRSRDFFRAHGWTLGQRLGRRLKLFLAS